MVEKEGTSREHRVAIHEVNGGRLGISVEIGNLATLKNHLTIDDLDAAETENVAKCEMAGGGSIFKSDVAVLGIDGHSDEIRALLHPYHNHRAFYGEREVVFVEKERCRGVLYADVKLVGGRDGDVSGDVISGIRVIV